MLSRTLRVEAANDERPGERERLRGIKRDDSIIRSALVHMVPSAHMAGGVFKPTARPFALDGAMFVDNALPGRLAFAAIVVASRCIRSQGADEIVPRYSVKVRKTCARTPGGKGVPLGQTLGLGLAVGLAVGLGLGLALGAGPPVE